MVSQEGANTHVIAIRGNFDDAQTGVKKIFADDNMAAELARQGIKLSSANSINIGRLVPQVAYYVYAYVKLLEEGALKDGEAMNIVVPTGNFGNILAAYLAGKMGIPGQAGSSALPTRTMSLPISSAQVFMMQGGSST